MLLPVTWRDRTKSRRTRTGTLEVESHALRVRVHRLAGGTAHITMTPDRDIVPPAVGRRLAGKLHELSTLDGIPFGVDVKLKIERLDGTEILIGTLSANEAGMIL